MKKKLLSLALILALCLGVMTPAFAATTKFADVPTTHWAAADIDYVVNKGLFSGTSTTTFSPGGKITQGQMSVVLGRYAGQDVDNCSPWYQKGMDWANTNRILPNNEYFYQPSHQLTRAEFATMMYKFADNSGKSVAVDSSVMDKYVDGSFNSGNWVGNVEGYTAMAWAVSIGLVTGTDTTHLSPKNLVTRAQVAAMLARYDRGNNQSAPAPIPSPTPTPSPSVPGSSGLLKNGKPATPENVIEMLKEIEKQYPTGTPWTDSAINPNTVYNPNPVSETISKLFRTIDGRSNVWVDTKEACGGFAAMVSDLIFPEDMECREVTDKSKVRPGDIIFSLNIYGEVAHVLVAISEAFPFSANPDYWAVLTAEGNQSSRIYWNWDAAQYGNEEPLGNRIKVYTRYPN